jgi:SAM-dependent methyltransferase
LSFRTKFVRAIYADHNASKAVTSTLDNLVSEYSSDALMLNIGAGDTKIDPRMKTLEIEAAPGIDFVGTATNLPFDGETVDLIVTQEVLEHVDNPFQAACEIYRVLKPGGKAFVQLPFIIGYHPCPVDYWRFTEHGIEQLMSQAGFKNLKKGIAVGPATGTYRILVEFFAILFSLPAPKAYRLAKGFFALLLYPLKALDILMKLHPESGRISGGYFVVCEK